MPSAWSLMIPLTAGHHVISLDNFDPNLSKFHLPASNGVRTKG